MARVVFESSAVGGLLGASIGAALRAMNGADWRR